MQDTPAHIGTLACAVRAVYKKIFQQYDTWLKATRLEPPKRPGHWAEPHAGTLHHELAVRGASGEQRGRCR